MTQHMPSLGPLPNSGSPVRILLLALVACGAGAGFFAWRHFRAPPPAPIAPPVAAPLRAPALAPPVNPLEAAGLRRVGVVIGGPLESALVAELGRGPGARLGQVVARALAWWVNVPADLRKGDRVDVLFAERPGEEPVVHALRFRSGKLAEVFRAYRFQPAGARFARLYLSTGDELEPRLQHAPLDDYEQITSLLRDGRGHRGVDFKTPAGTPVKTPFDGVVVRRNWNTRLNGNSIEIHEAGGARSAVFLHLSEIPTSVHPGARVSRGQVVAQSGNTGHSFAPHLHYQLMSGSLVLDPFQSFPSARRALAASDKTDFEAEMKRLDALMEVPISGS